MAQGSEAGKPVSLALGTVSNVSCPEYVYKVMCLKD